MASYLRADAERRNGACMLRIAGGLDVSMADALTGHANAAVQAIPGAVLVVLSGLSVIDARGAHVSQLEPGHRPAVGGIPRRGGGMRPKIT